ncbi:Endoplasmic reticulum junction formation protein lunapark-1 [Astathelohania contejeani]|uniref:Endoplasmic reticulum junction formation protein lunapark n=1 Tax=Astathelohania contejeani TaxID=164912 RepID=A0ABQ7HWM8_9MICR|nr:Endoplasmic reticulum junction formation protein lunapark-1 [Thelohania contejeani]
MGNILSKKKHTLREILFTLEEKISKTEKYLVKYKKQKASISYYYNLYSFAIVLSMILYCYFIDFEYWINVIIIFLLMIFGRLLIITFYNRKIRYNEELLEKLKETQLKRIEELKKETLYIETKEIIEKYESSCSELDSKRDDRRKNNKKEKIDVTPIKDITMQKRGVFDKVADLILGDDPSTMYALICEDCGSHNGLSHPMEYNLTRFYCFNCNHLNDKKIKNENDLLSDAKK